MKETELVWYLKRDGEKIGPISIGQIQSGFINGILGPTDLFWHPGLPGWKKASLISELEDIEKIKHIFDSDIAELGDNKTNDSSNKIKEKIELQKKEVNKKPYWAAFIVCILFFIFMFICVVFFVFGKLRERINGIDDGFDWEMAMKEAEIKKLNEEIFRKNNQGERKKEIDKKENLKILDKENKMVWSEEKLQKFREIYEEELYEYNTVIPRKIQDLQMKVYQFNAVILRNKAVLNRIPPPPAVVRNSASASIKQAEDAIDEAISESKKTMNRYYEIKRKYNLYY